jgi:hypothetical protein
MCPTRPAKRRGARGRETNGSKSRHRARRGHRYDLASPRLAPRRLNWSISSLEIDDGLAALLVALELQVRGVEEPYLRTVQGDTYLSYASARWPVPHLGRLRPTDHV